MMRSIFLVGYLIPFSFLSMYIDFRFGSLAGYLMMLIIPALLAFNLQRLSKPYLVFLGNIVSIIISWVFLFNMSGNSGWGIYFKPFTPIVMLTLISILQLIPQLIVMVIVQYRVSK